MKKLLITKIFTILILCTMAQAPQGISHQAVIRNAANELVANVPIGIQVSIIQGSADGTVVYSETHTPTSNANGLISFVIGQGSMVTGVFADINWAYGSYFIKTQADPTGGTNYTVEGTSQMLSVPYVNNTASLTITSPDGVTYNVKVNDNGEIIAIVNCPSSIVDTDGNSYNVIALGSQCWMKENLKTTKYRNGTPIENSTGNSEWDSNTSGAYAWYNNAIILKDSYGALYNWHAVMNTNGLCPTGWHVPTDAEFIVLTDYLGGTSVAGGKMKSTRTAPDPNPRWDSPNTGATNESNWSGLPGGYRSFTGVFGNIGLHGYYWSATEISAGYTWSRYLSYNNGQVVRGDFYKWNGFSVRCLRD